MASKQQRLDKAVAAIHHDWGETALRRLGDTQQPSTIAHLPTGFARLDKVLDIGGVPRGHLTHIAGLPTSGATTLTYKLMAQAAGEAVVYVDFPQTFDADYAARCGVDASTLLLMQPPSFNDALEPLTSLLDTAGIAVLALDNASRGSPVDASGLKRLMATLHRSRCALIVIERHGSGPFSDKAALRLHLRRERWLMKDQDVNGYRSQARILKNQFGRAGHAVSLVIGFSLVVNGDGT